MSELEKLFEQRVDYKGARMSVEMYIMRFIQQYETRKDGHLSGAFCFVSEQGEVIKQEEEATFGDAPKKPPIYDIHEMKVRAMELLQAKGQAKWPNITDFPKLLKDYKKSLEQGKNQNNQPSGQPSGQATLKQ